jgi:signal transduction histidine kinase
MVSLVNNLLDLRKIEEGRMDYKFSEIDLVGLVRSVVTELQGIAARKGLELKIELPQDQCLIKADEEKLRQVIQNLVDNAIKYTDKGWVKVGMTKDNEQVLVSVSDSGRGISADLLPRLFEQWTRDPKAAREIKGTGLGLYIAREIVNAHNGEIWAESGGEGKGSTFFVKLRLS